jgi:hypothetical protein
MLFLYPLTLGTYFSSVAVNRVDRDLFQDWMRFGYMETLEISLTLQI